MTRHRVMTPMVSSMFLICRDGWTRTTDLTLHARAPLPTELRHKSSFHWVLSYVIFQLLIELTIPSGINVFKIPPNSLTSLYSWSFIICGYGDQFPLEASTSLIRERRNKYLLNDNIAKVCQQHHLPNRELCRTFSGRSHITLSDRSPLDSLQ